MIRLVNSGMRRYVLGWLDRASPAPVLVPRAGPGLDWREHLALSKSLQLERANRSTSHRAASPHALPLVLVVVILEPLAGILLALLLSERQCCD